MIWAIASSCHLTTLEKLPQQIDSEKVLKWDGRNIPTEYAKQVHDTKYRDWSKKSISALLPPLFTLLEIKELHNESNYKRHDKWDNNCTEFLTQ